MNNYLRRLYKINVRSNNFYFNNPSAGHHRVLEKEKSKINDESINISTIEVIKSWSNMWKKKISSRRKIYLSCPEG